MYVGMCLGRSVGISVQVSVWGGCIEHVSRCECIYMWVCKGGMVGGWRE